MDRLNASGPAVRGCRVFPLFLALTLVELLGISFAAVAKQPDQCAPIAGRPLGQGMQDCRELIEAIISKGYEIPITPEIKYELHVLCTELNCCLSVPVRNNPRYPAAKWFCENIAEPPVPLPP